MSEAQDIALFAESARHALQDLSPVVAMRDSLCIPESLARKTWQTAVELGWTGICIPEASGGLNLGIEYLCALGLEIGRSLAAGPFVANLALAPALAANQQTAGAFEAVLAAIVRGDIVLTDWHRTNSGLEEFQTRELNGGINLQRAVIDHALVATHVLVMSSQTFESKASISCVMVDMAGPGIERHDIALFDPTSHGCALSLEDVAAASVWRIDLSMTARELDSLLLPVRLFATAQAVGVAQRALEMAIEHVTNRKQFGQPLGAFQAVKHQLADVYVGNEKARVLMMYAAREFASAQSHSVLDAHSAWLAATRAAISGSQVCLQLLGAMGFSWEHPVHLLLKRARSLAARFVGVIESTRFIGETVIRAGELQDFDELGRNRPCFEEG